jgi:ketosteroid isomerase-like protein
MSDTQQIDVTLRALVAAFNEHDLDRIMGHFAEDCVLEMPRGPHRYGARFEGKQAVREGLSARFKGLPDVHYGEDLHYVCLWRHRDFQVALDRHRARRPAHRCEWLRFLRIP